MSKYINNIDECLLTVFRKVINNNDYKALLIEGEFDEKEANEAWLQIYDQWNDVIDNRNVSSQFEITKQIEIKKNDYMLIQNCISMIDMLYRINLQNEIIKEYCKLEKIDYPIDLEELNYDEYVNHLNKFNFKIDIKKGVLKELDRIKRQSKNYLSQIETDIKKLEKENNNKKGDFDDIIASVDIFVKFPTLFQTGMTVKMFANYYNRLINSQPKKDG
ncbi:head scaffolding protein [Rhodobacteraceae phage LS06-2018-MD05]|nr:head scaffolding protein [Rhodobacteraceae phage LS06-2018-MD05]